MRRNSREISSRKQPGRDKIRKPTGRKEGRRHDGWLSFSLMFLVWIEWMDDGKLLKIARRTIRFFSVLVKGASRMRWGPIVDI